MSKALSAQAHKRIRIASGIVAVILGVLVAMTVWPTSSHAAVPGPRSTPVPAPHGRAGSIVRTPQPNCLIPTTATDSDMSVGNGHVGFLPVTDLVYTLPNGGTIVVTETSDRLQAQYAASRGTLTYVCVNNATSN